MYPGFDVTPPTPAAPPPTPTTNEPEPEATAEDEAPNLTPEGGTIDAAGNFRPG